MTFGEKIRELRKKKKLSQGQLSKALGYETRSYVSDVEHNRFIPQPDKLEKLSSALGVPDSELKELAIEAKLEKLGLSDPTTTLMMKEVPNMTAEEKKSIVRAFGAVIKAREAKHQLKKKS